MFGALEENMRSSDSVLRANIRLARSTWGPLSRTARQGLAELLKRYAFSIVLGDIQYLHGQWYVTHSGLLRLASRARCSGIRVFPVLELCEPPSARWVFKAVVFRCSSSKGFVGYGDADPSNTTSTVRGAEMRVAETRAVNRALRKAYGIGLCSVEELGSHPSSFEPMKHVDPTGGSSSSKGQPRLRDKLCLLIRRYELDPNLIKRYAADFCGTETLRDASRDLVEAFVSTVAREAANDRAALICKLNSYCQPEEVRA
jgi:hypothetical protein